MNWVKYLGVALLSLLAVGCTDYGKMKTFLQTEYDRINPNGNMAICYYVGNVNYPYLAEPITYFSREGWNNSETKRLNNRLPAFTKAGLLQEIEPGIGKDGKSYPQYTLTELGKQYTWSFKRDWGGGTIANESHFCFGRVVIDEVTKVEDHESDLFVAKTTETAFHFNYRLENVPDWAKNPALEAYGYKSYLDPAYIYKGQVWLTKKDGNYYNYGSSATIEKKIKKGN